MGKRPTVVQVSNPGLLLQSINQQSIIRLKSPYLPSHRILTVGEGDFSFSLALTINFGSGSNVVATCYDTRTDLITKYPEGGPIMSSLRNSGAKILFHVDAMDLSKTDALTGELFDRIVFNFPHVGGAKQEDVRKNQEVLSMFFISASSYLQRNGEIHVTLRDTPFYNSWNVVQLATDAGFDLVRKVEFFPASYTGYESVRTNPAARAAPSNARSHSYMFARRPGALPISVAAVVMAKEKEKEEKKALMSLGDINNSSDKCFAFQKGDCQRGDSCKFSHGGGGGKAEEKMSTKKRRKLAKLAKLAAAIDTFKAEEAAARPSKPSSSSSSSPSSPGGGKSAAPGNNMKTKKTAAAATPSLKCVICRLALPSVQKYNAHINSAKHAKMLKLQKQSARGGPAAGGLSSGKNSLKHESKQQPQQQLQQKKRKLSVGGESSKETNSNSQKKKKRKKGSQNEMSRIE